MPLLCIQNKHKIFVFLFFWMEWPVWWTVHGQCLLWYSFCWKHLTAQYCYNYYSFNKWQIEGIGEDGGVGRCGTHLPAQTHQKYMYMWNNSHWKQTGNWQKDSITTKAVRKIHMEEVEYTREDGKRQGPKHRWKDRLLINSYTEHRQKERKQMRPTRTGFC